MERKEQLNQWKVILIIGLLIGSRIVGFGKVPGGYNGDTMIAAANAKSLMECGVDLQGIRYPVLFEASGYGEMSVLMSYAMIPFIMIGGLNLVTITLPILLVSILGAMAVYGLSKDIFGLKTANIVLVLIAINPWHFMQSRWALDCNMLPHLFVCGLFLLNRYISSCKTKYLYGSMVFFSLCMYAYGLAFISVPIFLCLMCGILWVKKMVNGKKTLISMGVYFLLSFPIYACMLINALKLNAITLSFLTIPFLPGNTRTSDMVFFSDHPMKQMIENVKTLIYVVFYKHDNLLWNSIDGFGTIYSCAVPFVFLGLFLLVKMTIQEGKLTKKVSCLSLLAFYFCSLSTGIIVNNVNINRINIIFYMNIILVGIGINYVISFFKGFSVVFAGGAIVLFTLFLRCYFSEWNEAFNQRFEKDMMDAIYLAKGFDADEYYIDADDTYIIFGFDVDMEDYHGKTGLFNERFIKGKPDEESLDEFDRAKKVVYVQRQTEMDKFKESLWDIQEFGEWFTAVSKD